MSGHRTPEPEGRHNRSPGWSGVPRLALLELGKRNPGEDRYIPRSRLPTALLRKDAPSAKVRESYYAWRRTKRPRFPLCLCTSVVKNNVTTALFPQLRHRLLHLVRVGFIGFELQVRFVALASIGIFAQLLLRLCQSDPRRARIGLQLRRFL
jgi:hypothetical protein